MNKRFIVKKVVSGKETFVGRFETLHEAQQMMIIVGSRYQSMRDVFHDKKERNHRYFLPYGKDRLLCHLFIKEEKLCDIFFFEKGKGAHLFKSKVATSYALALVKKGLERKMKEGGFLFGKKDGRFLLFDKETKEVVFGFKITESAEEIPVPQKQGVLNMEKAFDFFLEKDRIIKSGSWYTIEGKKIQGKKKAIAFLEQFYTLNQTDPSWKQLEQLLE